MMMKTEKAMMAAVSMGAADTVAAASAMDESCVSVPDILSSCPETEEREKERKSAHSLTQHAHCA